MEASDVFFMTAGVRSWQWCWCAELVREPWRYVSQQNGGAICMTEERRDMEEILPFLQHKMLHKVVEDVGDEL